MFSLINGEKVFKKTGSSVLTRGDQMGLFSKKKDASKPEIPKFPEFPQFNSNNPPAYQPEFSDDMKDLPKEPLDVLPASPPIMTHDEADMNIPLRKPLPPKLESPSGFPKKTFAPPAEPMQPSPSHEYIVEKPLFIKVDDYREAMGNIEALKRTLQETEQLLEKLESIRLAEEEELKKAHSNLDSIKEQLLFIDKRLFEV